MKHRILAILAALVMPLTVLVAVPATASASSAGLAALAEWAPHTAYTAGQRVTYQGAAYECRQSHTSLPGWEPPNVLALWLPVDDDGGGGGDTQAPSVPGNLRSTGVTSSSVSLAWNASTDNVGVTGYEVYRGSTLVTTVTGTSHTDTALSANTSYTYTVRARDAAGNRSAASAAVTARTSTGGGGGGDKLLGYFVNWGVYQRNYHVKDIDTSGSAAKLTHINYAFADVRNGQCALTDTYADYDRFYSAAESLDGVADTWDNGALLSNFNQLRKLKQKHPHIKVLLSVGGWTLSRGFG